LVLGHKEKRVAKSLPHGNFTGWRRVAALENVSPEYKAGTAKRKAAAPCRPKKIRTPPAAGQAGRGGRFPLATPARTP
jgi:hypothetical protein